MVRLALIALIPCCLLVAGCGKKDKQNPVTVIVTIDDEPLQGAFVMFMPTGTGPGQGSYGRTGTDGRCELKHELTGIGLVPGTYKVTVGAGLPQMNPDGQTTVITPSHAIPPRYGSEASTPFKEIVVEAGKPIELKLTTKPGK